MQTIPEILRTRRSVSQPFIDPDRPVPVAIVHEAIESARWAPNHRRTEPWRFYLLGQDGVARLADIHADLLTRKGSRPDVVAAKRKDWSNASMVMILTSTSPAESDEVRMREDYAATAAAAQNFMIHLWSEGIGSKWSTASVWDHEDFWPLLGHEAAPEGTTVTGIFFLGYATQTPKAFRKLEAADITVDLTGTGTQ